MDRTAMSEDVLKILRRYEGRGANHKPLSESTSLSEELDIDSARMVDIVLDLEQQFGITISDDDLPKLGTVKDLVDLVEKVSQASKN